ncbi:MAG: Mobile element protein, partial [uncultured Thermomicrobiales bacterium]
DPHPFRCPRLARGGSHRHAAWHERVGAAGAGGARARSPRGRPLRVPWAQRRSGKNPLARRARDVALREAVGARAVPVAERDGRRGFHLRLAAVLHARRDRLEEPALHAQAAGRGL